MNVKAPEYWNESPNSALTARQKISRTNYNCLKVIIHANHLFFHANDNA
jgi:hypothetical protein